MDSPEDACIAIIIAMCTKRPKRRYWMKEWFKKRDKYSHINLLNEISPQEVDDYKNYFRMSEETFNKLVLKVEPFLARKDTCMRRSLPVSERLALTLRYLATGRKFEDLKFPSTREEWTSIANEFGSIHQFSNCLGAIGGKHIAIQKPAKSGSQYYNYKGFFSIVLLAVVNAKNEFIMVDVGMNGRISDVGVVFYSKFGELLQQSALTVSTSNSLPNTVEKFPYVFVADEAFVLDVHIMKPYPPKFLNDTQHEFNKRLSRARVTVENAFGILASRFGVFQQPIQVAPEKASTITMASCYLHNFLARETKQAYTQLNSNEVNEHNLVQLQCTLSRNSTASAKQTRDNFCRYFNNEGKLQ